MLTLSEKAIVDYLGVMNHVAPGGYGAFLARHSRFWPATPLPEAFARGTPRECFRNAGSLAMAYPELTYVEGMALHTILPTAHAWCVDRDGRVIDPTWDYSPTSAYLGIPFRRDFLYRQLEATQVWGLMAEFIPDVLIDAAPVQFIEGLWLESVGVVIPRMEGMGLSLD